ncbi:hypothetical protein MCAMS1_00827 [biofilm metagenome]
MKQIHQRALDLIKQDEWDSSHDLIQDCTDPLSCQIHGYLHRIEGDIGNARYWYHRAEIAMPNNSLEEELSRLSALL